MRGGTTAVDQLPLTALPDWFRVMVKGSVKRVCEEAGRYTKDPLQAPPRLRTGAGGGDGPAEGADDPPHPIADSRPTSTTNVGKRTSNPSMTNGSRGLYVASERPSNVDFLTQHARPGPRIRWRAG